MLSILYSVSCKNGQTDQNAVWHLTRLAQGTVYRRGVDLHRRHLANTAKRSMLGGDAGGRYTVTAEKVSYVIVTPQSTMGYTSVASVFHSRQWCY